MDSKKVAKKDLTGRKFGRLLVIRQVGWKELPSGQRRSLWACECDCGELKEVRGDALTGGTTQSCGCLRLEKITTHGLHKTETYRVYNGILDRCSNPNASFYDKYGALGISVEGDWSDPAPSGFLNFLRDMGERPGPSYTVERIDVTKGYSKNNCMWTDDLSLQSYNQGMDSRNKSGKTGVRWDSERSKWVASIGVKGKVVHLGRYALFEDAVKAREVAEIQYYGFNKE